MILYNYILFVPEFVQMNKSLARITPEGSWVPSRLAAEKQAHEALKRYASGMFDYKIIQKEFTPGSVISSGDLSVETCGFYLGKQLLDEVLPCWNKYNLAIVYAGEHLDQIKCRCGNFILADYKYCPECGRRIKQDIIFNDVETVDSVARLPVHSTS